MREGNSGQGGTTPVGRRVGRIALLFCLVASTFASAQTPLSPRRIADVDEASFIVTDVDADGSGRIVAMSRMTNRPVWTCAVPGEPLGIAHWKNLYLVGDTQTNNVGVYRLTGADGDWACTGRAAGKSLQFVYNLGNPPPGAAGFFRKVNDLGVDERTQRVFVVDTGDRKVKVFDNRGNFLYAFPETGPLLMNPTGIAVDGVMQEVLVSDYGDPSGSFRPATPPRIMIFGFGGDYRGQIDSVRGTPYFFSRPQGLGVDGLGRIFVADAFLGTVLVFSRSGTGIATVGAPGDDPTQLRLPLDLVIDRSSGDLFVTSHMTGRVEVFRGAGRLP
jgi:hypothetical protein